MNNYEHVEVKSRVEWRRWLKKHHGTKKESIWLVTYKKHTPHFLPYDAIVEEALCFGWIDSLSKKMDDNRTKVLVSPRRQKNSVWSKSNKERVAKLLKEKRMAPAGLAAVERAKEDGSWTFLDDVEALIVPDDLALKFATNPAAKKYFDAFSPSTKRGILQWIKMAKKPETRQGRISRTVEKAQQNQRAI